MSGLQVTMPLQMMCRLMVATPVGQNATLPLIVKSSLAKITDSRVLPSGYALFPEIGFAYKLTKTDISHDEARKMCLKDNGQLAVINSDEKVAIIRNHFNYYARVWIGLHNVYNTGQWTTIDGKSADNLPWVNGDPTANMPCASLSDSVTGVRNWPCAYTYPYLCEIPLPRN